MAEHTCERCGVVFDGRSAQRFCGKHCSISAMWDTKRLPCAQCGIAIPPRGHIGKYCSKRCADRGRWKFCERCGEEHAYNKHTCDGLIRKPPIREGERRIRKDGYVKTRRNGVVGLEHRLVMAELLGRPLLHHETPHHVNGDRADNRPNNLELWNTSQPPGQRVEDKVAWAREILSVYGDDFTQPRLQFE